MKKYAVGGKTGQFFIVCFRFDNDGNVINQNKVYYEHQVDVDFAIQQLESYGFIKW